MRKLGEADSQKREGLLGCMGKRKCKGCPPSHFFI